MTIPEASRLVLEAATMGQGGEIFLFDMGKPVKILDLAERMIKLSGLKPYEDIDIVFSGLRSGEKLYEELLCESENTLPTYHKKIFKAKHQEIDLDLVRISVEQMQEILKENNANQDFDIVSNIKQLVKTYKSNNSIYTQLDKTNEE
jgi:FlaA1/EpsC-like NDP-sugar epimerase